MANCPKFFNFSALIVPVLILGGCKPIGEERAKANAQTVEKMTNTIGLASVGMLNNHDYINFIKQNDMESVGRYLKAGMSPDIVIDRDPALVYSLGEERFEMAMLFIKAGANPNLPDGRYGRTPLMLALAQKDPQKRKMLIDELLQRGADVKIADHKGMTAVQYAEAMGAADLFPH